ncbi:Na+-dependent transporter [Luteitalea sp.]|jgi:BASS family bile acid:Na+ symporter|uniref:Na+-dependent transporter n=1 Tax=Luteitalea sp. TaxID=2004800 RepID=UPI0037C77718
MDPAHAIHVLLTASVLLLVLSLGLSTSLRDATTVLRRPLALARAAVAMFVIVPAVAATLASWFDFRRPVEIAVLAVAISSVPPILPGKQLKFGGDRSYVFGLLVAMSLVSIVIVPVAVTVIGRLFGHDTRMDATAVARVVGMTVGLPLTAGILLRAIAPGLATMAPRLSAMGTLLLAAGVVPVLLTSLPAMWTIVGSGSVWFIAALVSAAIASGHLLGGPHPGERTPLAIACAMRHPGVALAIARLNFPDEPLVPAAVLLYVLLAGIGTTLYGRMQGVA